MVLPLVEFKELTLMVLSSPASLLMMKFAEEHPGHFQRSVESTGTEIVPMFSLSAPVQVFGFGGGAAGAAGVVSELVPLPLVSPAMQGRSRFESPSL